MYPPIQGLEVLLTRFAHILAPINGYSDHAFWYPREPRRGVVGFVVLVGRGAKLTSNLSLFLLDVIRKGPSNRYVIILTSDVGHPRARAKCTFGHVFSMLFRLYYWLRDIEFDFACVDKKIKKNRSMTPPRTSQFMTDEGKSRAQASGR